MGAEPGVELERRQLGLRLGSSAQRSAARVVLGVRLLLLDKLLNREVTELFRSSREGFARSVVASGGAEVTEPACDVAGAKCAALKEGLGEPSALSFE